MRFFGIITHSHATPLQTGVGLSPHFVYIIQRGGEQPAFIWRGSHAGPYLVESATRLQVGLLSQVWDLPCDHVTVDSRITASIFCFAFW